MHIHPAPCTGRRRLGAIAEAEVACQSRVMRRFLGIPFGLSLCFASQSAFAVCSTATLQEDFAQADVVVHARVVASMYVADDEPDASYVARWGEYSPVTLDRLKVIEVFKGKPGQSINLFEEVSSGRYGVELGQDYLIFLTYYPKSPGMGSAAHGAMYVKYTCGQTQRWSDVIPTERDQLRSLSRVR